MKIGPKYKIARRLGAPIFEKTQSQKYALSAEKKTGKKFMRPKSDFATQLTEKQKARFFYGVTEKQFKNYVKAILDKKNSKTSPSSELFSSLESRLDNAVWRLGLASTHGAARQMVAHGHILVNGKRSYTPSCKLDIGDLISIREGSKKSPLFNKDNKENGEKDVKTTAPSWLQFDEVKGQAEVKGKPVTGENEVIFDLGKVIEFYQR